MATHYEVLGVRPTATAGELRAAYVAKARALHPDRHAGASETERNRVGRAMQDVNHAWTVLNDPRARRDYDESLRVRGELAGRAGGPSSGAGASQTAPPRRPTGPPPVVLPDFDPFDDSHASDHGGGLPALVRIAPVVLLLAVLGVIFVVTAIATGSKSVQQPRPTTVEAGAPAVGSCVAVPGPVVQASCDNPHALRVERHAPGGDECLGGTVPIRWGRDLTLCVRPPS